MAIRSILHVDMDAFYASIEQRDDPSLRGRPVLVGGAGRRGVVAAASYEARAFGCHSAQPMSVARRLCPDAIIVAPRGGHYHEVSEAVFAILESYTPDVEPLSIDEAFLDVTASARLFGSAVEIARGIRARVRGELGLTASVGVAPSKFVAKLASDLDKPDGLTVIEQEHLVRTLAPLPVERMWGVGPVSARRLHDLGIATFGDLAAFPPAVLARHVGAHAAHLQALARGEDPRAVHPDSRARTISQERTFGHDLERPEQGRAVLVAHVEHVARRLRRHGCRAGSGTIKLRFGDFRTITRSIALREPTDRTDRLLEAATRAYDAWASASFAPLRLIGFGAARLARGEGQLGLFGRADDERRRRLDGVTDTIEARFGHGAIHRVSPGATKRRSDEATKGAGDRGMP